MHVCTLRHLRRPPGFAHNAPDPKASDSVQHQQQQTLPVPKSDPQWQLRLTPSNCKAAISGCFAFYPEIQNQQLRWNSSKLPWIICHNMKRFRTSGAMLRLRSRSYATVDPFRLRSTSQKHFAAYGRDQEQRHRNTSPQHRPVFCGWTQSASTKIAYPNEIIKSRL